MKRAAYIIALLVLLLVVAVGISESDRLILIGMGLNPATMSVRRVQGKDGYMMVYSNATAEVYITRSSVTGLSVGRVKR